MIHIAALVAPLPAPIAGALNRTLLGMQRGDLPPDQLTGGPGKAGDVPGPTDIYGAASIARVGNDELKISIPPKNYDLNVRSSSDVPQESFSQRGITPEEVYPASSPPDDPNIPLEQQEIVKRYFKALAGG